MRIMYDSDRPSAIPGYATMVAGYIDGTRGRWTEADWERFPSSTTRVRIARRTDTNDGHVLDVEEGIVWPPHLAVNWVLMRRKTGADPTVYCNELYGWPEVRRAFQRAGVPEPHYWVARYNNVRAVPAGAVARQFANPATHNFGHFDLSAVVDFWPGVDKRNEETMSWTDKFTAPNGRVFTAAEYLIYANFYAGQAATDTAAIRGLLATVIANQKDDLDAPGVLAQLDTSVRAATTEALTSTVLPAIQRIEDALSRDDTSEAKAIITELAARLRPGID